MPVDRNGSGERVALRRRLGDSRLPPSGGSGGSTTVGGVSAATRRGADDALAQLLAKAAPKLGAKPEELEAWGGVIRVKSDPSRSMPFKAAAALLGGTPLSVIGANPGDGQLIDGGVCGVQMIEASLDSWPMAQTQRSRR